MSTEESTDIPPAGTDRETRLWAMFLHLSLLAGFLMPLGGLIVPIVIWQLKKADMPELNVHGKIVVNWIISEIIYAFVGLILAFVWIGIPLLIALKFLSVVFPIIGGLKANDGEAWNYPFSIRFLQ